LAVADDTNIPTTEKFHFPCYQYVDAALWRIITKLMV